MNLQIHKKEKIDLLLKGNWQHFGNKKSVSQNKICNRNKKTANLQQNLNKTI